MTRFPNIQRAATAAIAALALSTAFVSAAVGPAHAIGASPSATASAQVSGQATA